MPAFLRVRADFQFRPLDEIVCVSKFSIASARSTVTRTSTTPLAKRPSRHLPHNPLPPKWTLPSELRCTAAGMLLHEELRGLTHCAQGSRQARQGHPRSRPHRYALTMLKRRRGYATKERMLTDIFRLPRWRDPGPRRVHGRHHPLHHPQRQGPRYDQRIRHRKPQPEILDANMRKLQSVRMTFSASSSPSVRPGGSDKRAPKACVCDFWD